MVNIDDFINIFKAGKRFVFADGIIGAHDFVAQRGIQNVAHQSGLAGTGHAGNACKRAEFYVDFDVFKIVLGYAGQFYGKSVSFASFFRQCHAERSCKILTGQTLADAHNFFRSPDGSNISSVYACPGT